MFGQICGFLNRWGIIIFFLMLSISINPQQINLQTNDAFITGRITDGSTNEPLRQAAIIIKNTNLGATSDTNGNFSIKGLYPGKYQLMVSMIGYKTFIKDNVKASSTNSDFLFLAMSKDILIIPEIKITGNNLMSNPYELISTNHLTYNEMKTTPGNFNDIVRSISVLPGIGKPDMFRNDMVVRGGSPSENLILINDLPVPNISHYGNQGSTGGAVSFIDLDYIKNAFLSTGGFSAAYGDKISSVLSLELKNGTNDHISGKVVLSFLGAGISADGPLSKNTTFIFSARKSYLDMAFKLSGFIFTPEYYDILTSIHTRLPGNSSISFLFLGSLDNVKIFNTSKDERKNNPLAIGSREFVYTTGISYEKITNEEIYKLSFSRNSNNYKTFPNFFLDNKSIEIENILSGNMIKKSSKNDEINLGFTAKVIDFRINFNINDFVTSYKNKLTHDTTNMKSNYYKFGFFSQYNHHFDNGASIVAGIRYDYFNPLKDDFTLSPRISFSYPVTELLKLNLSTGIYYQTPSYLWLAGDNNNTSLKSIKSNQYVLGIDYFAGSNTVLNIEGFYKKYDDYPVSKVRPYLTMANTGASFSGVDDNFEGYGLEPLTSEGKGFSKGINLQVKSTFQIPLYQILFNVTYGKTCFSALDGITRPGSYNQEVIINFLAGYKFDENLKLNIKFSYASGKPYTPFNKYGVQDVKNYNSLKFPPQHSLDVRIDKDWVFSKWKLTTFLDIQNVYNRKNKNYIRWDRRLNQIAKDPVLGILPSIGISTEL